VVKLGGSSFGPFFEASGEFGEFEKLRGLVDLEFEVEEGLVEFGVPTFYVRLKEDSKEAFSRLLRGLDPLGFVPVLRMRGGRAVLQVVRKRLAAPSRRFISVGLFFATVGTMLLSGYLQSQRLADPILGAVMFAGALMAILVVHEMGHTLAARRYGVEASYPYFIPGPPPVGTFGAVIQQQSLAPNKDALFDLGASGPIAGFVVSMAVAAIGLRLSHMEPALPPGAGLLPGTPLLFELLLPFLVPPGVGPYIMLHPVAFAGWVGMLVTLLNLIPAGMLDGGHAVRGLLGESARRFLPILVIALVLVLNPYLYWLMAMVAFFMSTQRHPGPLDDVSKVTTSRKLVALVLVLIFVLCAAPVWLF